MDNFLEGAPQPPPTYQAIKVLGESNVTARDGVIIMSSESDPHAAAVAWALRCKSVRVARLSLDDAPHSFDCSLRYGAQAKRHFVSIGEEPIDALSFRSVWNRRNGFPHPPQGIHPADWKMARGTWKDISTTLSCMWETDGIVAVNSSKASGNSKFKPLQLHLAPAAGLHIPRTCVSNMEHEIVDFIRGNSRNGKRSVVKGLFPFIWIDERATQRPLSTSIVDEAIIKQSDVKSALHIYQEYVEKNYEVRVLVCGRQTLACKLASDCLPTDIRSEQDLQRLGGQHIDLPQSTLEGLLRLFDLLGLVFGSADFVVDNKGIWNFLEVNEQGNFLWMEELNPRLPVLDMVTDFLSSGDPKFIYEPETPVKFANFEYIPPARTSMGTHRFIGFEKNVTETAIFDDSWC